MNFPPPTPTSPHLYPTLQKPISSPPTPTLSRGVGVGEGDGKTFPHLASTGTPQSPYATPHAQHGPDRGKGKPRIFPFPARN